MVNIRKKLLSEPFLFVIWASLSVFLAYFCMYMLRKPFTASVFDGLKIWGLDYKIVLVISQVLGYTISKFLGIKIISELKQRKRLQFFLVLLVFSLFSLVGFAITPIRYGPFWLFLNGLPLGLIWGIVFSYCEGRNWTEVLTVVLASNFIISSGIAKTVGRVILAYGHSEQSMPMIVGFLVLPLIFLSLWMLSSLPLPSMEEINQKSERLPMGPKERREVLSNYWPAILVFVIVYLVLTVIRDLRDNFAVEIWVGLGYSDNPEIFTVTELPVTLMVLFGLGMLYRVKENRKALYFNIWISISGLVCLLMGTFLFLNGTIGAIPWMVISGTGLFLPYILLNGILFDRFIAHFGIMGNVGFIMYIADATGYLGSVAVLLYKNLFSSHLDWLPFFTKTCIVGGTIGLVCVLSLFGIIDRSPRK
ncbi:MAG: DUF5690 family protein [Bacteroidota bacterium]